MAWATSAQVSARLPWLTIDGTSPITSTDVTNLILQAEGELKSALSRAKLATDYTGNAIALAALESWVVDYVAGLVLRDYQSHGFEIESVDYQERVDRFKAHLENIREDCSGWGAELSGGDAPDESVRLASYATNNEDGIASTAIEYPDPLTDAFEL